MLKGLAIRLLYHPTEGAEGRRGMELDLGNSTRANVSLLGHLSKVQRVFRELRRCGRPGRVALFLRAFVRPPGGLA